MKKLIIFGTGNIAELAYYYITEDTDYDISAFTVEKDHIKNNLFMEKPVVAFENIEDLYDPKDYYMFAPISAKCLNKFREKIYKLGKEKGYRFINYISSRATILTKDIGENCFILEDNTIQHRVKIGNNCIIWSGNHIGHHSTIGNHVFITSHVIISGLCIVKDYCYLGVNSSLRDKIILEEGTVVAMACSIVKNTEGNSIYMGVPGKLYKKCDDTIEL